jgi:hypothetical protein
MSNYLTPQERVNKFFEQGLDVIMKESMNEHNERQENPYLYSSLVEYLNFDSWSIEEGLLLLGGVSPDGAIVRMGYIENHRGGHVKGVRVDLANILDVVEDLYFYPIKKDLWREKDRLKNNIHLVSITTKNEEELAKLNAEIEHVTGMLDDRMCQQVWDIFEEYNSRLSRIYRMWSSGFHSGDRFTKQYFFDWATDKGIEVKWLTWAVDNGYLSETSLRKDQRYSPKMDYGISNEYLLELDIKVKQLAEIFPKWKESQRVVQTTGNLIDWIKRESNSNDREAQIIKNALSKIYTELKKR